MSRRGASSDERDPCLTQNRGYFVDQPELAAHLEAHKGQPQEVSKHYSPFVHYDSKHGQRSTCVSHNAVNNADTRDIHGFAVSGVGTVDCARHNMKRPNSIGDLQLGEK
jgi:Kyakuja-Dileera-Zisupton transposase